MNFSAAANFRFCNLNQKENSMLKTVSSIANAIGALNFKGTWDANANSPALASSVGAKGDYYVVGTAGTTALNGISNWGVGDWATFNGSVWQRVEGGADLNGTNLTVTSTATFAAGTAAAPAITTSGDSNTGIFFPAADTIAFTEGGAESFRVNNLGFMGVNKTNPIHPIDVNGRIGNGAQQFVFSQSFATWNAGAKLVIPITRVGSSNVVNLLAELDIVFAVSDGSASAAGAGKFILEIRHNGTGTPTLLGSITTVYARTITSAWVAYVGTGAGTGQIEITNNGVGWNFSGAMNRVGLNMFSGADGVTVGTIAVV